MISNDNWRQLAGYARDKILALYDPTSLHPASADLRGKFEEPHKGFYVGLEDSNGQFARAGFMQEGLANAFDSCDRVVSSLFDSIRTKVDADRVKPSQFHMVLVQNVQYMPDPTRWDQSKDGIYFQWGQDYRGLLLPYQIARLNLTQVDIMDRLCQFEAGVAASLWRLPCGLCWKITCQQYSS